MNASFLKKGAESGFEAKISEIATRTFAPECECKRPLKALKLIGGKYEFTLRPRELQNPLFDFDWVGST